jgi:NADPH:quinone reductase-like Zn-dependent oxidoreductase
MMRSTDDAIERAKVREVAAIFHSDEALEGAVEALLLAGFDRADIDRLADLDEVRRRLGLIYVAHEELADVAEDQTRCSRRTWIWNTPAVLGTDGAEVVAEVGSRVRRLKIGDKVYAYSWANPKGGFYAEYVAVPSDKVAHVPAHLDLEHAGAIPTTGLTALQGIDDALALKRGDTIIIHGASGGVGTLAIQFAKLCGARVLATATGVDGLELVREMGADLAVDSRHEDVAEAARRLAHDGVDAILALAGGDELERALEALRPGGRLAFQMVSSRSPGNDGA